MWILGTGGLPGRKLESKTIIKGVAASFRELEIDVLARVIAFRILYSHIHGIENSQVIKAPLRLQHRVLAERAAGLHRHLALNYKRPGVQQAGRQYFVDKDPLAF